jgi:hypothetical protein
LLPAGAVAGWGSHPLESAALSRRTPIRDIGSLCSIWRRADVDGNRQEEHFPAVPREAIEAISLNNLELGLGGNRSVRFQRFPERVSYPGFCKK